MTDRWIEMFHTLPNHPLLTRKGAAAPSPERPAAQSASRIPGPAPQPLHIDRTTGEGDLAGLIKRCGAAPGASPARAEPADGGMPAAVSEDPVDAAENPLSWMIARRATLAYEAPVRAEPSAVAQSKGIRECAPQRRQLTVRVAIDMFVRFDRVARLTGRSYQELQAEAIERLLKRYHN